ncbi:MAG: glutathione S-transferase family protein [Gammaproteobacteria bacterium]|nr:glutathione S-transferase family protein [Gammaproteobacteria bacterium]
MKVYGDHNSGNCYKIKLVLSILNLNCDWEDVDILANETQTSMFLSKNPNGKIPVLELDDGRCLSESNAIVNYLATGSPLLPADPFQQAKVLQWQFFEQYSHEPYIAVARFIAKYLNMPSDRKKEYEAKQAGGHKALGVMEQRLFESDYLVGKQLTTADISLFAYTHVAHEGGFDLSRYPAVVAWITRVMAHPGYVGMGRH